MDNELRMGAKRTDSPEDLPALAQPQSPRSMTA